MMLSINNFEARIIFSIGKLYPSFLLLNQSHTTTMKRLKHIIRFMNLLMFNDLL